MREGNDVRVSNKKQRLVLLLVLLVSAFLVWFAKTPPVGERREGEFSIIPTTPGYSLGSGSMSSNQNVFRDYRDPEDFKQITYPSEKNNLFIGRDAISIIDRCNDAHYTLLIFRADIDYRKAPSAAVYNSASSCEKGEVIRITIQIENLSLTSGRYYYFIADQGESGVWYNPR